MRSILLVEDHKLMAETLVRVLNMKGNFKVASEVWFFKNKVLAVRVRGAP